MKGIKHFGWFHDIELEIFVRFLNLTRKKKTTRLCADINEVYFFML